MSRHTLEWGTTVDDDPDTETQALERRLARATRLTLVVDVNALEQSHEKHERDVDERDPVVIRRHPDRWFDRIHSV